MALNNSGPISFGGSTVGQSINLELGVSATALASINSTSFRTLAGVASGQISLSNFYGKSSNSYYLTYLGTESTTAGSPSLGRGFAVSASSGQVVVPFYYSGYYGIGTLNSSGGLQASYSLGAASSGNYVIRMPLNNYGASDRVYIMDLSNEGVNYFTTASPSTLGWSTQPCSGLILSGDAYLNAAQGSTTVVNSSGTVITVGFWDDGKHGYSIGVWPANSNGTQSTGGVWTDPGQGVASTPAIALKTDGTPVVFASSYFYVFPANLTSTGSIQRYNSFIPSITGPAICDSSNNLWIQCNNNLLQKVSAAYSTYIRYSFGVPAGTLNTIYGAAIYNDTIYMIGQVEANSQKIMYVFAFNTTTATITWIKSFTATTGTLSGGSGNRSIVANSSGVYINLVDIRGGNQIYVLKMPLNGSVSNTSYTLGGDTFTFATPASSSVNTVTSGSITVSGTATTFQQPSFNLQPQQTLTSRSAYPSIATTVVS